MSCCALDASKTQTALISAISGPLSGACFDFFWSHVPQCLLKFPVILYCFWQDASSTQTALGSAISGLLFGLFLDQFSSKSTLSLCCVVLLPARRFRNSNKPRICDFRPSFWTLFGTMFLNICANFLSCGFAYSSLSLPEGNQYAPLETKAPQSQQKPKESPRSQHLPCPWGGIGEAI